MGKYASLEIEEEVKLVRRNFIVRIKINETPEGIINILKRVPKDAVVKMVELSEDFNNCVEIYFVKEDSKNV